MAGAGGWKGFLLVCAGACLLAGCARPAADGGILAEILLTGMENVEDDREKLEELTQIPGMAAELWNQSQCGW